MTVTLKQDVPLKDLKAGDKGQVISRTGKNAIVKFIRADGLIEHVELPFADLNLDIWEPQRRTA